MLLLLLLGRAAEVGWVWAVSAGQSRTGRGGQGRAVNRGRGKRAALSWRR